MKYYYLVLLFDFNSIDWGSYSHKPKFLSDITEQMVDIPCIIHDLKTRHESKDPLAEGALSVIYDRQMKEYKIISKVLYDTNRDDFSYEDKYTINNDINKWLFQTEHTGIDNPFEKILKVQIN